MAITEEWPVGERHAHHSFEAHRAQREQALAYREHHTKDAHTHDGDYAAIDEALTRIDALERPTNESRLEMLRKKAEARVIRRLYNKEANWLVANGDHLHYQHRLRLHETYPDQQSHPGSMGLALTDAEKKRIGPTYDDLWKECWERVAEFHPDTKRPDDIPAWLVPHYIQSSSGGHTLSGVTSVQVVNYAENHRRRARLMMALPSPSDSDVRDDYFEPKYWTVAHDGIRDYARLSTLGDDETTVWHDLAKQGLSLSTVDDDILAICGLVREARLTEESFPIWTNPPATLPEVTVTTQGRVITASWNGVLPAGTRVVVSAANAKDQNYLSHKVELSGTSPIQITMGQASQVAVLVRYERTANINQTNARTLGKVVLVGSLD